MTDVKSETANTTNTHINQLNVEKSVLIDIPKDIVFPNELNKFLKEKVEYLSYENGMLKKNVHEYENKLQRNNKEIGELKEKLKCEETSTEYASVTSIARTKIVELSKKLREKNAELEVTRTRYNKLEHEFANLKSSSGSLEIIKQVNDKNNVGQLHAEIKMLTEKFNTTNSKLFDEKNANVLIKNELKLAHKLLQEEIGETFESIQQISNSGSWKGRANSIMELQRKNNELREKLKSLQDKEGVKLNDHINMKKQIWEHKMEKASKEIELLKAENADLKKKVDATKTRTKSIELEATMWKTKFNAVSEQSDRDRELISTLTSQHSANFNAQCDMIKKKEHIIDKLHKEINNLKQELKMEACKVQNMQIMLDEKASDLNIPRHNSLVTPSESLMKIDDRLNLRIEAEQMRFAELILVSNQRLNIEREAKCNAEYLYKGERLRAAKLEAKLVRMQLGETTDRSSYSAILTKYSSESDKSCEYKLELAEENIKALQTRLQIEKREKERDLAEFTKILKNCKCLRE